MTCHECGEETYDLNYCEGEGCDKWLCDNCGPVCSECLEHQQSLKEIQEEEKKWKPMETLKDVDEAVTKAAGKAFKKGFATGIKLWGKATSTTFKGLSLFGRISRPKNDSEIGTDGMITEDPEGEEITPEEALTEAQNPRWWFDPDTEQEDMEEDFEEEEESEEQKE
jgi:hypothetical protein